MYLFTYNQYLRIFPPPLLELRRCWARATFVTTGALCGSFEVSANRHLRQIGYAGQMARRRIVRSLQSNRRHQRHRSHCEPQIDQSELLYYTPRSKRETQLADARGRTNRNQANTRVRQLDTLHLHLIKRTQFYERF